MINPEIFKIIIIKVNKITVFIKGNIKKTIVFQESRLLSTSIKRIFMILRYVSESEIRLKIKIFSYNAETYLQLLKLNLRI